VIALGALVRAQALDLTRTGPDYPAIIREGAHAINSQVMAVAVGLDLLTAPQPPGDMEMTLAAMRIAVGRLTVFLQRLRKALRPNDLWDGD